MLRSPLKSSGTYRLSIEWHYNRRFKGQLLYRIFFLQWRHWLKIQNSWKNEGKPLHCFVGSWGSSASISSSYSIRTWSLRRGGKVDRIVATSMSPPPAPLLIAFHLGVVNGFRRSYEFQLGFGKVATLHLSSLTWFEQELHSQSRIPSRN